jgi:inhibitor of growth protein 4
MAIARTGVYVDDYLECKTHALPFHGPRLRLLALTGCFCVWNRVDSSTLAGDLQRILSTMRELDDRAHGDDFSPFLVFLIQE